jgi:hypothetical protein
LIKNLLLFRDLSIWTTAFLSEPVPASADVFPQKPKVNFYSAFRLRKVKRRNPVEKLYFSVENFGGNSVEKQGMKWKLPVSINTV